MDAQQQAIVNQSKQAMQSLIEAWTTLRRDEQAFRNAVYQHTGVHPLSAPADIDQAMVQLVDYYRKLLSQLEVLGV
jgi:hypothetical protein